MFQIGLSSSSFPSVPISGAGLNGKVGEKYALTEAGEVVDICGRSVAGVDDAEAWLGLEALAQGRPSPGMTRVFGAGKTRSSRDVAIVLFFEPTVHHSGIPLWKVNGRITASALTRRSGIDDTAWSCDAFVTLGTLGKVDFAAKDCIVFHSQAKGPHITLDHAAGAQLHSPTSHDVALNLALDQHVLWQ